MSSTHQELIEILRLFRMKLPNTFALCLRQALQGLPGFPFATGAGEHELMMRAMAVSSRDPYYVREMEEMMMANHGMSDRRRMQRGMGMGSVDAGDSSGQSPL